MGGTDIDQVIATTETGPSDFFGLGLDTHSSEECSKEEKPALHLRRQPTY